MALSIPLKNMRWVHRQEAQLVLIKTGLPMVGTVEALYLAKYWAEQAAASADNFDDTYSNKSADPTVDNDGDALTAGDLYFNTSSNVLRVYDGSSWNDAAVSTSALPLLLCHCDGNRLIGVKMAQNFRRYTLSQVGTVAADIPDGANFDTYDTIVGIMLANARQRYHC